MKSPPSLIMLLFLTACVPAALSNPPDLQRVGKGIQLFYNFTNNDGTIIHDRSGLQPPLNASLLQTKDVNWKPGALELKGNVQIRTARPPARLISALKKSQALSIEVWLQPGDTKQEGPARIVSLSSDTTNRNFTLGQEGNKFDFRLRTTRTSSNGLPSLVTKSNSVKLQPIHLLYTHDRKGKTRFYVDGKVQAEKTIPGDLSKWNSSYQLLLGNEQTKDRPWKGKLFLVAIYDRALAEREVLQNFRVGPGAAFKPEAPDQTEHFELTIAPLLARHCLECHDSANAKGKLDLSRKAPALKGGETSPAIVPGKSDKSLLWESVSNDEMPKKRTPLTKQEKNHLQTWIDGGAQWSADLIDPAVYIHRHDPNVRWVQRLTQDEYIATVRASLGINISTEARKLLPQDKRADGFRNTAYNLTVDLKHIDAYAKLATKIVEELDVTAFARRFSKSTRVIDKDMRNLIAEMGEWILRGSLEDHEINAYRGISTSVVSTGGNFEEAVSHIIEAMLQSPRFIYRMENQQQEFPSGEELACRISYLIWGAPPDEALRSAGQSGQLSNSEACSKEVERMLKDPRAVQQSMRFASEWLQLDRLNQLKPNSKKFPEWEASLAQDMRRETLAFFLEVIWKQRRPMTDLFNAQFTFATPQLAKHYGLPPQEAGLVKYDLSKVPERGGLLTQGSALTIGGDEASMVTRGLFLLHDVLRGVVRDPPPGLNTTPIPSRPGLSQRKISEDRVADRTCGGCHIRFEPLAFGLERYDGLGAHHAKDHFGNTLREDGQLLVPGEAKPQSFQSSAEMMQALASSDRVFETIVWKLTQFSLGRPLGAADRRSMEKIVAEAAQNGGTYASIIKALINSDLVQRAHAESSS